MAEPEQQFTTIDYFNLMSSAIGIVLGVLALVLSIYFFKQATNEAKQSEKSANEISASVDRLEKIFDTLYSDTFSMMRDTVTDMRAHIWHKGPSETEADPSESQLEEVYQDRLDATKSELFAELQDVSQRLGIADEQIAQLRSEFAPAVAKALDAPGHAPESSTSARKASAQNFVIQRLMRRPRGASLDALTKLGEQYSLTEDDIATAIFRLRELGRVTWEGEGDRLDSSYLVTYIPRGRRLESGSAELPSQTGETPTS